MLYFMLLCMPIHIVNRGLAVPQLPQLFLFFKKYISPKSRVAAALLLYDSGDDRPKEGWPMDLLGTLKDFAYAFRKWSSGTHFGSDTHVAIPSHGP